MTCWAVLVSKESASELFQPGVTLTTELLTKRALHGTCDGPLCVEETTIFLCFPVLLETKTRPVHRFTRFNMFSFFLLSLSWRVWSASVVRGPAVPPSGVD
jgi:hypothetical protein